MFTDLNNLLKTSQETLEPNLFIGISESKADSSFLIHHFVSYFLKQNVNVSLLSFCQSFNHFNSVGNKIGNNLTTARDSKSFSFIEGLKLLGHAVNKTGPKGDDSWKDCVDEHGSVNVKSLYHKIQFYIDIAQKHERSVLIIDNVSKLTDIGVAGRDVISLIHYLKTLVVDSMGGSLVLGLNNDLGDRDEDSRLIRKYVQHSVDLCLHVSGLDSGYCRDVHGQLTATWMNHAKREKCFVKSTQFKLTDKTCALFASGMSSAVL